MKKIIVMGAVFSLLLLAIFAGAKMFDNETEARGYYNKLVNAPRFIDVEIYDVVSDLDGAEYEVYWRAKVYDNAAKSGNITFEHTQLTRVNKALSSAQIQSKIETQAKEVVNAWQPAKPKIQHTDHALYGKIIRIVG